MRGAWAFLAVAVGGGLAGDEHDVLPPSRRVERALYATGFEFAEGPALDEAGNLFVVNYRGNGNIGRITPDGTASVFCDLRKLAPLEGRAPQANGLKLDQQGRLIVADAGGGRLLRVAADGSAVEVLSDRLDGNRLNSINDVALDVAGNIYFSDPGESSLEKPIGSIYRYNIKTAKVARLDTGLAYPNGLAVTPDQKHLCVAETQKFRLLMYDLGPDGVSNRRVLIEFPRDTVEGVRDGRYQPDGMVFDARGRLYVAMWTAGVVNVVDVERGKTIRQYNAGGSKATNCHFHGGYLYTTVAAKEAVFRLKLGVRGFSYNGGGKGEGIRE